MDMMIYATYMQKLLMWLQLTGPESVVIFALVFTIATLILIPASPLAAVSGFLYGPILGTLVTSSAGLISATIAFLISRHFLNKRINRWINKHPRVKAINSAVGADGFRVVFLLRLASVLPFIPLSYLLGISDIKIRTYAFATWLGLFPGTLMYVFLGSLVTNVSQFLEEAKTASYSSGVITAAGVLVIIIVMIIITRGARKALYISMPKNTSD